MRASIILALASAAAASRVLKRSGGFVRRQDQSFNPGEDFADSCADFGPNYVDCGDEYCVDYEAGESCCDNQYTCPTGSFCLIDDLCCPDGLDPESCAADNGVELPDDFGNDDGDDGDDGNGTDEPTEEPSGLPDPTPEPEPEDPEPEVPPGDDGPAQAAASGNKAGILGAVVGLVAMAI